MEEQPPKRGRGRPKGSKNKPKAPAAPADAGSEAGQPSTKQKPGRPKGSKNKGAGSQPALVRQDPGASGNAGAIRSISDGAPSLAPDNGDSRCVVKAINKPSAPFVDQQNAPEASRRLDAQAREPGSQAGSRPSQNAAFENQATNASISARPHPRAPASSQRDIRGFFAPIVGRRACTGSNGSKETAPATQGEHERSTVNAPASTTCSHPIVPAEDVQSGARAAQNEEITGHIRRTEVSDRSDRMLAMQEQSEPPQDGSRECVETDSRLNHNPRVPVERRCRDKDSRESHPAFPDREPVGEPWGPPQSSTPILEAHSMSEHRACISRTASNESQGRERGTPARATYLRPPPNGDDQRNSVSSTCSPVPPNAGSNGHGAAANGSSSTGWEGRPLIVEDGPADSRDSEVDRLPRNLLGAISASAASSKSKNGTSGPAQVHDPSPPPALIEETTEPALGSLDELLHTEDQDDEDEEFTRPVSDDDDDEPPTTPETSAASGAGIKSHATLPTWLPNAYAFMRETLKAQMASRASGKPDCYERGSFYEEPSHAVLDIANAKKTFFSVALFYQPRFFIWLPHLLVSQIPCPACFDAGRLRSNHTCYLHLNGWPKGARRVVDLDSNIFLIGHRYVCPNKPACGKSYQAWSPDLLRMLPLHISSIFTHHLSHRLGITDRLAQLLVSLCTGGFGPGPFTQMLRSLHYHHYDQCRLQYLDLVHKRRDAIGARWGGRDFSFDHFSDFRDLNGFAGSIPTECYFRKFFDRLCEAQAPAQEQHRAMLSARIISLDHSHKVPKRLGKVGGSAVFSALHTTVNEYGEIRQMMFTPTKAHDQVMPALAQMPASQDMYGHSDTEAAYTDNVRADKLELEVIFPALLKDVNPVNLNYAHYDLLEIPSDCPIQLLTSTWQINTKLNSLMSDIRNDGSLTVGFDMEWPVDKSTRMCGTVAVIQIAYPVSLISDALVLPGWMPQPSIFPLDLPPCIGHHQSRGWHCC